VNLLRNSLLLVLISFSISSNAMEMNVPQFGCLAGNDITQFVDDLHFLKEKLVDQVKPVVHTDPTSVRVCNRTAGACSQRDTPSPDELQENREWNERFDRADARVLQRVIDDQEATVTREATKLNIQFQYWRSETWRHFADRILGEGSFEGQPYFSKEQIVHTCGIPDE
jgi:hypothetical protein